MKQIDFIKIFPISQNTNLTPCRSMFASRQPILSFFTAVREGFQSLWYWFEQKMNLSRWNDSEISSSDLKARYATLAPQDKNFTYRRHKRCRIAGKRANSRCILSLGSLQ